jgi:hypothetical protein
MLEDKVDEIDEVSVYRDSIADSRDEVGNYEISAFW